MPRQVLEAENRLSWFMDLNWNAAQCSSEAASSLTGHVITAQTPPGQERTIACGACFFAAATNFMASNSMAISRMGLVSSFLELANHHGCRVLKAS